MNPFLIFTGATLTGLFSTKWFEKKLIYLEGYLGGIEKSFHIKGFHLHHSLCGFLLILLGLFYFSGTGALIAHGVGTGIITQHTITEKKLVFVNRTTKEELSRNHYHLKKIKKKTKKH